MKLRELIERLEEIESDLIEGLGDDVQPEILAAYQRTYPLVGEIDGVVCLQEDGDEEPILFRGQPVVWLAVGSPPHDMNPYAPRAAFEVSS